MSLIPNESYSFPDHFLRAQSRARAQHQKNLAAPSKARETTPARPIMRAATAPSRPVRREPEPEPSVEQEPAPERPVERASVPVRPIVRAPITAPRVASPAKVTPNVRPRGLTPRPATPAKPARPAFVPHPASQPKIDKAKSARPAAEEFQFDLFPEKTHRRNKPGRGKLLRFLLCESLAALVLIPCAFLIFSRYLTDPTLIMVTNIVAIASAIALAIIPILFFAFGPTLPRGDV